MRPGNDGQPVPQRTNVFRIGKDIFLSRAAKQGVKQLPIRFDLSSDDKKAEVPRLSIWVEELTTADQAWDFMGSRPVNTVVACLTADGIRGIAPPPGFAALDVVWESAM